MNGPYPANQIRNLYFNGKLAYRMGFTDSFYPSLLMVPDQIGSSRATVGMFGGSGAPDNTHFVTTTSDYYPFGAFMLGTITTGAYPGMYITQPGTNLEQAVHRKDQRYRNRQRLLRCQVLQLLAEPLPQSGLKSG